MTSIALMEDLSIYTIPAQRIAATNPLPQALAGRALGIGQARPGVDVGWLRSFG
jgi:hypothetical protein